MIDDDYSYRVEPDAEFADRLERELVGRLTTAALPSVATESTIEALLEEPTPRRRWRTLVGAAAAVLLLVSGTVVVVARSDDARVAAGARENAEEVARGFLDSYTAFDADRALMLLTEHAVAKEWGSPEEFRLELELLEASGWKQSILDPSPHARPGSDGCDAYDFIAYRTRQLAPGRLIVYCTYVYHGLRSDAIGRGPFGEQAYWAIVVDKGRRIVSVENRNSNMPFDRFDYEMRQPFRRWVSYAHPLDALAMYEGINSAEWKRTEESVRLWDQHTREYVALGSAYIARADAICKAARTRLRDTFGPPPTAVATEFGTSDGYYATAARVLEETLTELRAVPPPEAFLEEFGRAYASGDRLVAQWRQGGVVAGFAIEDAGAFASQPGLSECTKLPK